jgi:hypothetical protein
LKGPHRAKQLAHHQIIHCRRSFVSDSYLPSQVPRRSSENRKCDQLLGVLPQRKFLPCQPNLLFHDEKFWSVFLSSLRPCNWRQIQRTLCNSDIITHFASLYCLPLLALQTNTGKATLPLRPMSPPSRLSSLRPMRPSTLMLRGGTSTSPPSKMSLRLYLVMPPSPTLPTAPTFLRSL